MAVSSISINSTPSLYSHDAHEFILRRLGDYLFYLRQHAKAGLIYQTAARSFSYDKAWKHHACALEMASVCQALAAPSSKDLDHLHEQILQSSATKSRNATRATVLLTHLLHGKTHAGTAIPMLVRMVAKETEFHAALFLEQIALRYASTTKRRMALKYLVLAGNKYGKVGLRPHAIRCFTVALAHFPTAGWDAMRDHVQASLARHYFQLGAFDLALHRMLHLLRSLQTQSLDELLYLYRHHPAPQPFYDIPIPTAHLSVRDNLCVNETATWRLRLENLMQIPITLDTVCLLGGNGNGSPRATNVLQCAAQEEKGVTVHALSSGVVPIDVAATTQGPFDLQYVHARLNGVLPVRLCLHPPVRGTVLPTQPRVELHVDGLPTAVAYIYQVSRLTLTLKNTGHVATGPLTLRHEGMHVSADDTAWPSVPPASSFTKHMCVQWLPHPPQALEWSFQAFEDAAPFRIPLHLTLTPLFVEATYLALSPQQACISLTASPDIVSCSTRIEGTVFGTAHPPLVFTPPHRTSYTHVVTFPATTTAAAAASQLPYPFLSVYCRAPYASSTDPAATLPCFFHCVSPVEAYVPLSGEPCPPGAPRVRCTLVHVPRAARLCPLDVSVCVRNLHTHALLVAVQVASDAAVCMTGLVETERWVPPLTECMLDLWQCYPLAAGVHDLSAFVSLRLVKEQQQQHVVGPDPSFLYVV